METIRVEEVSGIIKQVQNEVQKYDAVTRESMHGGKTAIDMEEVREWSMRKIEILNKALFVMNKTHLEEWPNKEARNDIIDSLYYLKQRVGEIEAKAMQVSTFRSVSPQTMTTENLERGRDQREGSPGSTVRSTPHYPQSRSKNDTLKKHDNEREDPFNRVVTVNGESGRNTYRKRSGSNEERLENERYASDERAERDRFQTYVKY